MSTQFSYLSHVECSVCGRQAEADQLHTISLCCARPLLAQYDLAAVARDVRRDEIACREATMWRYHELLPIREERHVRTIGEGMTPLLAVPRLAPPGMDKHVCLFIKDEGQN